MLDVSPILIVSGDKDHRDLLFKRISKLELRGVCCETAASARAIMARQAFSAVISEDSLPDGSFCDLIRERGIQANNTPIVVVSRRDDWDSFLVALGAGAFDYVAFPPSPGELERVILAALFESGRLTKALSA